MEEKIKQKRQHKLHMEDRNRLDMTGINDVISFDLNKVVLESDYGAVVIKGDDLHVSKLSVEKGELAVDGKISAIEYSEINSYANKKESLMTRLFK
ncbi:MAG: sporulation protein YabP [Lachnospira sp.]